MLTKLENCISKLLSNNIIKYGLVLATVLLVVNVRKLPYKYLEIINSNLSLIILGLIVVYLVYIDIVLAVTLTLFIIVCIQEYNARKSIIISRTSNIDTGILVKDNIKLLNNNINNNNINNINNNTNINNKYTELIAASSYGSDLIYPDKNNTDEILEYEKQIGKLLPEQNIQLSFSNADDKYQSISFNQSSIINSKINNTNLSNKEEFNYDSSLETKLYDHPASKTMTELLRLEGVRLVDDEVLTKLQSNAASLTIAKPPCAIESLSCSMNAQSF